MIKKLKFYVIVVIIILSSTFPATAINLSSTIPTAESEKKLFKTEYWGLCVGPYDYKVETKNNFVIDAISAKNLLISNGWNENHIELLTGKISEEEVIDGLTWLDSRTDKNDIVFIYITTHGAPDHAWFPLGDLEYDIMDKYLDKIECKGMGVIINSCYSGSAIPSLKQEGRVILTSSSADKKGGFNFNIINGLTIIGDFLGNNDYKVSIEEAFNYNQNYWGNPENKDHQISDLYDGELNLVNYINKEDSITDANQVYSNWCSISVCDYLWVRQSFKPKSSELSGVLLKIGYNGDRKDMLNIGIYNQKDECITEKIIQSESLYPAIDKTAGITIVSTYIDFPDVKVEENETYYLVFKKESTSSVNWWLDGNCMDRYKDGELMATTDEGKTWKEYSSSDPKDLFFLFFEKDIENNEGNIKDKSKFRFNSIFDIFNRLPKIQRFLEKII